MTGTGVLHPLRDLCSVETISNTISKGVASDGVVAAFAAEAVAAESAGSAQAHRQIELRR
jgi:hypothetical protein